LLLNSINYLIQLTQPLTAHFLYQNSIWSFTFTSWWSPRGSCRYWQDRNHKRSG